MRCFLAIVPPPETLLEIEAWRRQNWPTLTRVVKPASYHLTLVFLGDIDASQQERLCNSLADLDAASFSLTLDDTGYFAGPQILWIGPGKVPEAAGRLATRCRQLAGRAGIRTDKRSWRAHLTLARRVAPPPSPPLIAPCFSVVFDGFGLYESTLTSSGARYRLLQDWPLRH